MLAYKQKLAMVRTQKQAREKVNKCDEKRVKQETSANNTRAFVLAYKQELTRAREHGKKQEACSNRPKTKSNWQDF